MRNFLYKIQRVPKILWSFLYKNIKVILAWGILYYFFPTFTVVVLIIIGIPISIVTVSTLYSFYIYKKVVLDKKISIKDAYDLRQEMANKYFKLNKLAKVIFISIIEGVYDKENVTTKDNVENARKNLELPELFTERDVKRAWKKLLKENHPDLVPDHLKATANKRTIEINESKETLITYLKDNGVLSKFNFT